MIKVLCNNGKCPQRSQCDTFIVNLKPYLAEYKFMVRNFERDENDNCSMFSPIERKDEIEQKL